MNQDSEFEPPEAKAYEAQSGEIIEMLKRLLDEFRTKLCECQKEEMNSKHTYEMVQADLIDSIENSGRNLTEYLMKILALLRLIGWRGWSLHGVNVSLGLTEGFYGHAHSLGLIEGFHDDNCI